MRNLNFHRNDFDKLNTHKDEFYIKKNFNTKRKRKESLCLPLFSTDYPTCRCLQLHMNCTWHCLNLDSISDPLKSMRRIPRPHRATATLQTGAGEKEHSATGYSGRSSCSVKVQGRGQRSEITGLNLLPKWGRGPFLRDATVSLPFISCFAALPKYKWPSVAQSRALI